MPRWKMLAARPLGRARRSGVKGSVLDRRVIRTYVATDDAGNQAEATQTLTVFDNVPPTFTSIPESATQECGALRVGCRAEDACSDVTLTWSLDLCLKPVRPEACSSIGPPRTNAATWPTLPKRCRWSTTPRPPGFMSLQTQVWHWAKSCHGPLGSLRCKWKTCAPTAPICRWTSPGTPWPAKAHAQTRLKRSGR